METRELAAQVAVYIMRNTRGPSEAGRVIAMATRMLLQLAEVNEMITAREAASQGAEA